MAGLNSAIDSRKICYLLFLGAAKNDKIIKNQSSIRK